MHRQISHPLAVFMSCYVYRARSLWYLTIREGTLDVTCSPPSFCFLPNLINTLKPSQIKRELSPRHWLAFKAPLSMCTKAPSPEKRKTIQISQGFQHELVKGWVYCKSVLPNPTLSSEAIQPHLYIRGLQAALSTGMSIPDKSSEKALSEPCRYRVKKPMLLPTNDLQPSPETQVSTQGSEMKEH